MFAEIATLGNVEILRYTLRFSDSATPFAMKKRMQAGPIRPTLILER
jgi:hypothetical protein